MTSCLNDICKAYQYYYTTAYGYSHFAVTKLFYPVNQDLKGPNSGLYI